MSPEELRDRTVIVVDDDEVQLEVMGSLVRSLGARCETVAKPRDAFERLRLDDDGRYSMLITDIFMPEEDGFSLTRRVRAMAHPLAHSFPILGVSADTDPELYDRAISAGMNGMMLKPVTAEVMGAYFTLMFKAQRASSVFNARLQDRVEADRKIREFVRSTAASLRTPLTAILGIAPLLDDKSVSGDDRSALVTSIVTACETMNKTLNDCQIRFTE